MEVKLKQTPIKINLSTLAFELEHESKLSNKKLFKFIWDIIEYNDDLLLKVYKETKKIVDLWEKNEADSRKH